MADNQGYTSIATYIDSTQLAESTETSVTINGNHVDNMTEAKGFAGQTLGASIVEISIKTDVPSGGWEFNPSVSVLENKEHEVTVFLGGLALTTKGYFQTCEVSKAVNDKASMTMSFKGSPKAWE